MPHFGPAPVRPKATVRRSATWIVTHNSVVHYNNVISATAVTTNSTFYPVFVAGTGAQTPSIRTSSQAFQINPSTGNLQTNGTISAYNGFNAETVPFFRNSTTIAADYTVTTSYNELSIGPITVNSGITVTVNSGATWTVV
mgnify:CR=1 FL=1